LLRDATGDRFNIVHGDVLKFDWDTLWPSTVCGADWLDEEQLPNTQIVGNLPFSVATPLMIRCGSMCAACSWT
jgi:dimethyladenosine transferase 1